MSYEAIVEIEAGGRKLVDARLSPLASAGGLRVEDELAPQASVLVDGADVGQTPWEGRLSPGSHLVQSRSVNRVSAPVRVMVVQGQTVLARLHSGPVAAAVTIHVEPSRAEILLNDVLLAHGTWEGSLPVGIYHVRLREEGYRTRERSLALRAVEGPPQRLDARLEVDPEHPRWPRPPSGKLWAGAWAGLAAGPTLRSRAEARCPDACTADPWAIGLLGGVRVGYELPAGLSIEAGAGYLSLKRTIERTESNSYPAQAPSYTATYELTDRVRLRGPFVGAGASWGLGPFRGLTLRTRVTAGVMFATSVDTLTGRASTNGESTEVGVEGKSGNATSTALFLMPELALEKRIGAWNVGAGLGVWFVPTQGPDLPHDALTVSRTSCSLATPGAIACAPVYGGVGGERAYGPFAVLVPQLTGRYSF